MDLAEHLLDYFDKPKVETKNRTPDGVCPICWGYQEYDHKIRKLYLDKQIDVSNHKNKFTFMRQFVKDNISGIRLVEGEEKICPTCGFEHPDAGKTEQKKLNNE